MLTSLSLIFLVGLSLAALCHRIRLPQIVGMLVSGVILGPYVLDFFDPTDSGNIFRTPGDGIGDLSDQGGSVVKS